MERRIEPKMLDVANDLRVTVEQVLPRLAAMSEGGVSVQRSPGAWSAKEIIGHLIDSACNNQQKFVRAMAGSGSSFPGYEQDHWVDSQKYNDEKWGDLIALWRAYNIHLAYVIARVEPDLLSNSIDILGIGPQTLEFLMRDYVVHLKHHLRQILPDLG
jgi:hypothetical protein